MKLNIFLHKDNSLLNVKLSIFIMIARNDNNGVIIVL